MKVITANPITVDNARINNEERYMNFTAKKPAPLNFAKTTTPVSTITTTETPATNTNLSESSPKGEKKAGHYFDKTIGGFVKAKESGLLDTVLGLFGKSSAPAQTPVYEQLPADKKGLSKGAKIAIAVGGVVVLGTIIYLIARKKK